MTSIFPLQARCNLGARKKKALLDVDPEILVWGESGDNSGEMMVIILHEKSEIREKCWPTAEEARTDTYYFYSSSSY
jgi:hypothetical protein